MLQECPAELRILEVASPLVFDGHEVLQEESRVRVLVKNGHVLNAYRLGESLKHESHLIWRLLILVLLKPAMLIFKLPLLRQGFYQILD